MTRRDDDWFRLWHRTEPVPTGPEYTSAIVHMTCLACTPPHNYTVNADGPVGADRCPRCGS